MRRWRQPRYIGSSSRLGVVGPDVEQDRQRPRGVDAADQRVERELADRDAHAADALVADAEDPLAVGDDDDVHLLGRPVAQHLPQVLPVRPGQVEPPGPAPDLGEAPAALGDRRRVHQGQRGGHVGGEHGVEEVLVAVLQRAQVDVAVEVGRHARHLAPGPSNLHVEGGHRVREQAEQAELTPLRLGERGPLRAERIVEYLVRLHRRPFGAPALVVDRCRVIAPQEPGSPPGHPRSASAGPARTNHRSRPDIARPGGLVTLPFVSSSRGRPRAPVRRSGPGPPPRRRRRARPRSGCRRRGP